MQPNEVVAKYQWFFALMPYLFASVCYGGLAGTSLFLMVGVFAQKGKRRRWFLRGLASFLTIPAVLGVMYVSQFWIILPQVGHAMEMEIFQETQQSFDASSKVHAGDSPPKFSVVDIDGNRFDLAALRGKVVVLDLFATWCGPCNSQMPHLQKIWVEHQKDENFALLVIGREEGKEILEKYRREHQFTFPMAPDEDRAICDAYAVEGIPKTYVIGADGKVKLAITVAFLRPAQEKLESTVNSLLADIKTNRKR